MNRELTTSSVLRTPYFARPAGSGYGVRSTQRATGKVSVGSPWFCRPPSSAPRPASLIPNSLAPSFMQLTLAQGYSVTTMLAVAAVAILLTGAFYYRAFRTLPGRQWRTLLAFRVAAILLVVLLLFRPVFSYQNEFTEKPAVIFLLDASSSMSIADDASGVTRFNQARGKLEKWCEKLKDDFRVLPIAFAQQAEVLDGPQDLPDLAPTGKATSLLSAYQPLRSSCPRGGGRDDPALRRHPQLGRQSAGDHPQAGHGRPLRRRGRQPAQRPLLSRHPGHRHRLPRPDDAQQRGPGDRLDRRHRARRPGRPGVPR